MAGEGVRKFDLIRWNLLSAKIDEFKESYRNAVNNGSYPAKIYYKFKEDNFTIDVTTFNYNEPVEAGYFSANFFGRETTDAKQEQLLVNLPSISAGLNRVVKTVICFLSLLPRFLHRMASCIILMDIVINLKHSRNENIRNILAKGVFMLLVSLLAMACTEKSDWGIDASYSRPFGTNEDGINVTKDEK